MLDGAVAVELGGEFPFLQFDVSGHLAVFILASQFPHAQVERMETSQRDELKLIAHGAEFVLEPRDGFVVKILAPIE